MRLTLRRVPASRVPSVPRWALAVLGLWAAVIGLGLWWGERTGSSFVACHFKRLTGRPCPSCGSTRGVLALLRGEWREAFEWNPLLMTLLVALLLLALLRAATGRRFELEVDLPGRVLLWALALIVVLANWWWIWDRA